MQHLKEPTGRLARWALELQQWDVRIEHRKEAMHRIPDALSRIQEEDTEEVEIAAFEEVKDPWYLKRIEEIQISPVKYKSWRIDDGLIYRQRHDSILEPVTGEEDTWKLVIPAEHRDRVF